MRYKGAELIANEHTVRNLQVAVFKKEINHDDIEFFGNLDGIKSIWFHPHPSGKLPGEIPGMDTNAKLVLQII